ncbi:chitin recognition protein [Neofusicoccum parvum]|uniref:Chitin recognition protein n=1 Tax=Neofusicoccum parvum TaxID=310453 RepID=A0ACB5S7H7_9PEZI|nr:chitin recognition protein [Neofusicoccum parvum]
MVIRSLSWAPVVSEKHRYRSLPVHESIIRVLELDPFDPKTERPRCRLRDYSLTDERCPPFTALSYSWNSPVLTEEEIQTGRAAQTPDFFFEIECNAASWMVTESLYEVLEEFSKREELRCRLLWIDALCIDQTNPDEKAHQISLMGEIYARASQVVIWLGRDASYLDDFAWIHGEFAQAMNSMVEKFGFEAVASRSPLDKAFFEDLGLEMPLDTWYRCWRSYFRFYQCRRWFRRAWIVQEAALARDISVRCGSSSIHWISMWAMARFILFSGWAQALAPVNQTNKTAGIDQLDTIWVLQNVFRCGGLQAPDFQRNHQQVHRLRTTKQWCSWYFLWALDVVRGQNASDPRDKVYSVLGIADKSTPPHMATPVLASYRIDMDDLYIQVARKLLKDLPLLSILSILEAPEVEAKTELPSWVPDWSRSGPEHDHLGWADIMGKPVFDCALVDSGSGHICSVSNRQLFLCGAPFDRVIDVSESMDVMVMTYWLQPTLRMCLGLKDLYSPTAQDRVEVLWRTLIADWTGSEHPAPHVVASTFYDWILVMLSLGIYVRRSRDEPVDKYLDELSLLDEIIWTTGSKLLPTKDQVIAKAEFLWNGLDQYSSKNDGEILDLVKNVDGEAMLYGQRVSASCGSRRLYRTAGGYLGLGPKSLRKGDEVWLIQGARAPFVLRTDLELDAHVIVGETYLHGFMHGEMVDKVKGRLRPVCVG